MARQIGDRILAPATAPEQKPTLGSWAGSTFRFHSPAHERDWQQWAYRQSVDPDRWQQQSPVDHKTQSLLDGMPHLGSGQYFFGPDGKYRRSTMDLREDRDIIDIRRKAFNDLAQSGVTWSELAQYPDDQPHPGEAEALAVREAKRAAAEAAAKASNAGQASDRFGPENAKPDLTRVAPGIGLDLAGESAEWGLPSNEPGSDPVLIATTDKAVSGLPKEVEKSQPFVTPSPLTPGQRRSFNENLVGRAANDNRRSAANDNTASAGAQSAATRVDVNASERLSGRPIIAGGELADEERQIEDRLFNWQRKGLPEPGPSEYAVHVVNDEGRFAYLEDMKDEWSRLLIQDPEKILQSMLGEVDKLSNAAQRDFYSAYHRTATPAEIVEIDDAVAKMVFAPAEHWAADIGDKPNEHVGASRPFFGLIHPLEVPGAELSGIFAQAAKVIAEEETFGGRLGSKETREMAELMTLKLAAAIQACGGQVRGEFYGRKEKFIPKVLKQFLGGSYSDGHVSFTYNGRSIGLFANHAATFANGVTLKPNEASQIYKLVNNIARGIREGDLDIDAAGIGHFSKRKPGQSKEDYLKAMDDFVNKMVDCKRPFLIKIAIEKATDASDLLSNDN
jgi:hypothetical protein